MQNYRKQNYLRWYIGRILHPIFNKIMGPTLGLALEISKKVNCAKGKNIPQALLDAVYKFIDNKLM